MRSNLPFSSKMIKKNSKTDEVTTRVNQYSKVLWKVIDTYLRNNNFNMLSKIRATYSAKFRIKSSTIRGRSTNLVSKTLTNDEYVEIYKKIIANNDIRIQAALLLMLFLGLTAEEVCGLDKADCIAINNYSGEHYLQITKEYVNTKDNKDKNYYLSNDLREIFKYRNVPIPRHIYELLKKNNIQRDTVCLFCDKNKHRLKPDKLKQEFRKLFNSKNETLTLTSETPTRTINLSFDHKSYIRSLESMWRLYSLHDSEIRYLIGRTQIETAAKHYIDFNNPHKQYAMLANLNYAVDNMSGVQTIPASKSGTLYNIKDKKVYIGGINGRKVHIRLRVINPCKITVENSFGFEIQKEG